MPLATTRVGWFQLRYSEGVVAQTPHHRWFVPPQRVTTP